MGTPERLNMGGRTSMYYVVIKCHNPCYNIRNCNGQGCMSECLVGKECRMERGRKKGKHNA